MYTLHILRLQYRCTGVCMAEFMLYEVWGGEFKVKLHLSQLKLIYTKQTASKVYVSALTSCIQGMCYI